MDMELNMKIQITQDHINRGKDHSCTNCPIALALTELIKDCFQVFVGVSHYRIEHRDSRKILHRGEFVQEISNFVCAFDRYKRSVEPIEIDLAIPTHLLEAL